MEGVSGWCMNRLDDLIHWNVVECDGILKIG